MSYTILDKNLQTVGVMNLNSNKYYADQRQYQIADDSDGKLWNDTLTLTVPQDNMFYENMTEGYHILLKGDDGLYYCFRINSWEDTAVGETTVKVVNAVNLCIWDLSHTILNPTTLTNATAETAFTYALQGTTWTLKTDNTSSGQVTETISQGSNAQTVLQQMNTDFSVEIKAYVTLANGKINGKYIDIEDEIGSHTGRRIEYGRNITDISRTGADDSLFTKLHVYGGTPSNANTPISIAPVNGGNDFLIDDTANDLYNGAGKYLEGWVQNENIKTNDGLLTWGKQQLAYYNHPKFTYTVSTSSLDWTPDLGDYVTVVDFSFDPALTVQARVIQKVVSQSDQTQNAIVLGEFVEIPNVTPADIISLQSKALAAQEAADKNNTPTIKEFTPDGTDFADSTEQKRIIVRVYSGMSEVTYQYEDSEYIWQKINADGTHDTTWESNHENVGNTVLVDSSVIGCIIRCTIDDGSVSTLPIYFQNGMDHVVNTLASIQRSDTLSVLFITDTHYASGGFSNTSIMMRSTDHMKNASYLTNKSHIDLVIHGGDLIDGDQIKSELLDNTDTAASSLFTNSSSPIVFLNGNHDDGSLYSYYHDSNKFSDVLVPSDRWNILKQYEDSGLVMNSGYENRLYGYYDFSTQKIRVVCVNDFENPYIENSDNTNKYITQDNEGIMQDQLSWLANTALKLPDSTWSVMIFQHGPLKGTFDDWPFANYNLYDSLLSDFVNGTAETLTSTTTDYEVNVPVDFTAQGKGEIIAIFNGHTHHDGDSSQNGIKLIQTLDSMARNDYPNDQPDRPYPSLEEDGWDVVTVDRTNRKIYMTRFGAGSDRTFTY